MAYKLDLEKAQQEWIQKASLIHNNFYYYSKVEYKNNSTKIKITCPLHGEFEQIPKDHLSGRGCRQCGTIKCGLSGRLMQEEFIERSSKIHNNKYDYSKVEYSTSGSKVIIICPLHGEFKQLANDHLRGFGCVKCSCGKLAKDKVKTQERFLSDAKKVHGDKYNYELVLYSQGRNKIDIICNIHGIFRQVADAHLRGAGCPNCRKSRGEIKIFNYLVTTDINFLPEKRFDNCKNINTLPFDFYLPDFNLCIEFDGRQHFESIDYFGGEDTLKFTKERDQIKNKYCLDKNIHLLRIPYWKFSNIELIIEEKLKELNP